MAVARHWVGGAAWAVLAILIWSGGLVMLRLGVSTSLNAYDVTAVRFGVAGVLLAPFAWRRRDALRRLGARYAAAMIAAFGAPYTLLISLGMQTAPASAAGALNPGMMAIAAVALGRTLFGDRLDAARIIGVAVTAAGIGGFAVLNGPIAPGHAIFIGTGVMWAAYAAIVRARRIAAWDATVIVGMGSALVYLPIYLIVLPKQIVTAPMPDIAMQAVAQGVLASVVAVFAFNRSAELLGALPGSTLPALIPLATLGLDALILGEGVGPASVGAAALVGVGLMLILAGTPAIRWATTWRAGRQRCGAQGETPLGERRGGIN